MGLRIVPLVMSPKVTFHRDRKRGRDCSIMLSGVDRLKIPSGLFTPSTPSFVVSRKSSDDQWDRCFGERVGYWLGSLQISGERSMAGARDLYRDLLLFCLGLIFDASDVLHYAL